MKKVPDDMREALMLYGRFGHWNLVAKHLGCSTSTLKNALGIYLAGHDYTSSAQAIWYEFVERR